MDQALMSRLPMGTAGFEKIRSQKIYVDKTALIHAIATDADEFFLARPRRFGKSLLVSTLKSLFSKGLADFKGLAIEKLWTDKTYPVVHLDFARLKRYTSSHDFNTRLNQLLLEAFWQVGFRLDASRPTSLIDQLSTWMETLPESSLVILIDEYDAPLTAHLNQPEIFEDIRSQLAEFYATIKTGENCLRFFFMTGITKFRNTSIFSELNNITDLTYNPKCAELLGWTESEIRSYFGPYVDHAAQVLDMTPAAVLESLRRHYDGYAFETTCTRHVYAPWSVLNFLKAPGEGFQNYWYLSAGQPTVLKQYLEQHSLLSPAYYTEPKAVALSMLNASQDYQDMRRETLLTQSGYLTITSVLSNGMCLLGYPNEEVSQSMAQLYVDLMLGASPLVVARMSDLPEKLAHGTLDEAVSYFNTAFASISYQNYPVKNEAICALCVQILLIGAAMLPSVEVQNAYGRSDLEVTIEHRHWVMEFKFLQAGEAHQKESASRLLAEGLAQIRTRRYGEQALTNHELIRAALVFSEKERRFVAWQRFAPENL